MVHLNPRLPISEDVNADDGPAGSVFNGRPDTPSLFPRRSGSGWSEDTEDASGSEIGTGDTDLEAFDTAAGVDETVFVDDDNDEEVTGLVEGIDDTAAAWDGTTQLLERSVAEDPSVKSGSPPGVNTMDLNTEASKLHSTGENTIDVIPETPPPAPLSCADAHQKWLRENLRSLKKARRKIDIVSHQAVWYGEDTNCGISCGFKSCI
ncbi:hypothetical protein Q9L58_006978 [Maublancomyces gigas]|uniref:Uncharacterized protein n=1 Tax=Discina gigas TaxID=1032678 RepID=A0ABR3GDV4_9PEZI